MFSEVGPAPSSCVHLWDVQVSLLYRPPFYSYSLLFDIVPFHLPDTLVLESAYSFSFSPALLQPLSSGTLPWDHLAGVNTFPTKPAWIAANVHVVLNRVMEIPGYVEVRLGAREPSVPPLVSRSSFSFHFLSPLTSPYVLGDDSPFSFF